MTYIQYRPCPQCGVPIICYDPYPPGPCSKCCDYNRQLFYEGQEKKPGYCHPVEDPPKAPQAIEEEEWRGQNRVLEYWIEKANRYKEKWEHETNKTIYLEKRICDLKTQLEAMETATNEKKEQATD